MPADITYGTNNEFGFDYLRDNMVRELPQKVQRGLSYAIVDEVDNILIDEARTPLIISGQAEEASSTYTAFARSVKGLEEDADYVVDHKAKHVALTDEGINRVERALKHRQHFRPGRAAWCATSRPPSMPRSSSAPTATTLFVTAKSSSSTSSPAA